MEKMEPWWCLKSMLTKYKLQASFTSGVGEMGGAVFVKLKPNSPHH